MNERIEKNLVNRIAELPPEISAEPIYKKLKEVQEKVVEQKSSKENLELGLHKLTTTDVTTDESHFRIQRTVAALEQAPKEKQKAIFNNILQFAEFHPTIITLGVFGQAFGLTGTDGGPAAGGAFRSTGCSTTIKNGGEGGIRTLVTLLT